jgi:hypothetical protein
MKILFFFLILSFALTAGAQQSKSLPQADIEKYFDLSYKKNSSYAAKPDFAQLEYKRPLDRAFLKRISIENILAMDIEMADQLYARLTAGPIPDGVYNGYAKVLEGSPITGMLASLTPEQTQRLFGNTPAEQVGGMVGTLANTMWKGKEFFKSQRVLRNVIPKNENAARALQLLVKGFNADRLPVHEVTIHGRNEKAWKLFPSKLYCGQSLVDSRRESVIIDYAYGDQLPGYDDSIDFFATRHGLYVRDEIRMVRPGLYLGKAYMNKIFALTFVLHRPDVERQYANSEWPREECWTGTQQHKVSAR